MPILLAAHRNAWLIVALRHSTAAAHAADADHNHTVPWTQCQHELCRATMNAIKQSGEKPAGDEKR
jgi:hypothetical protein